MTIVHVLSSFATGGQEYVALELASRQRRRGHKVLVASVAPPPDGPLAVLFRKADVETATFGRRPGFDFTMPGRLSWWFLRRRVSVVHTHNPVPLIYAAAAAKMTGKGLIHTKHGKNPRSPWNHRLRRPMGRLVDAFVAVSEATAEQALQQGDCTRKRLKVITNGIDVERFARDDVARAQVRAELSIPADAWVVGHVGRLDGNKNQALLVRAASPHLSEKWQVVIVGDGPRLDELRELAQSLPQGKYVHVLGRKPDVERYVSSFDVFALCSGSEGLPLVIPEAMATGLPVVSTPVGGIPKVVEDGKTGFLVPVGDEEALRERLHALSQDRQLAEQCGQRGREAAVRKYSAQRMLDDYMALYREAVGQRVARAFIRQIRRDF